MTYTLNATSALMMLSTSGVVASRATNIVSQASTRIVTPSLSNRAMTRVSISDGTSWKSRILVHTLECIQVVIYPDCL